MPVTVEYNNYQISIFTEALKSETSGPANRSKFMYAEVNGKRPTGNAADLLECEVANNPETINKRRQELIEQAKYLY